MQLAQQALLSTVDRILIERGDDPSVINSEDKLGLATQMVQLCVLHESDIRKAAGELADALGSSPHMTLVQLASTARMTIESQRSVA